MLNMPRIPLMPTPNALPLPNPAASTPPQSGTFGQMLSDAVNNVAGQQSQATYLMEENLLGHPVTNIEVFTAIKQAELSLKAMLQIRNKVVDAYKELKQIQV